MNFPFFIAKRYFSQKSFSFKNFPFSFKKIIHLISLKGRIARQQFVISFLILFPAQVFLVISLFDFLILSPT